MSKNYVRLCANDITIDPRYQRGLDESRVDAMAKSLDEARIGVPVLSLRKDNSYVVLDAQHRLEALRRAGKGNVKVLCEVHNGLSLDEEAALFLKLNNGRKAVRVFDKYRARLVAKEHVAVEFTRIVESLGLKIGAAPGKNTVCAIQAVESVYRRNANLFDTLSILKRWGHGEPVVFDGELIKDVSRFLIDHEDQGVNADEFVAKLARIDPGFVMRKIKGKADMVKDRRLAANSEFRDIYNQRRHKTDRLSAVENLAA